MSKFTRDIFRSPAFWLGSGFVLAGIGSNLTASDKFNESGAEEGETSIATVMREGKHIEERVSSCHPDGDRLAISFSGQATRDIIALENLAAQRIVQAVLEDPNDRDWVVSGTITEFQGRNYILLERASRVSK